MKQHRRRASLLLIVVTLLLAVAATAGAQQRVYKIATGYPFIPWDVGPTAGVSYDLLVAACAANGPMRCEIQDRPYTDCVDTDEGGAMVFGPALTSGEVDGCMGWFATAERQRLGAEFSDGFSNGPIPQLIAADGNTDYDALDAGGSLGGAAVGIITGWFSDADCLGGSYSDFNPQYFDADTASREAMIAALTGGTLDLVFWDSNAAAPDGTHLVGAPIEGCGPLLALLTYPPSTSRPHHSDGLRRDFDCGLALIRQNGTMEAICAGSTYPGGDPNCIFDGPPPTVQCLADNPGAAEERGAGSQRPSR